MKKKLFNSFSLLIIFTVVIISIANTMNFYDSYKDFHEKKLVDVLDFLKNVSNEMDDYEKVFDTAKKSFRGIRVTLIDPNGDVLYDTDTEAANMEKHDDRKEFIEALDLGNGSDVRKSDTLGVNFYYFATRMKDGNVLRVSEMQKNIMTSFKDSIIPIIFILFIGLIIAFLFINHISNKLVKDLELQFSEISQGFTNSNDFPELYPLKRLVLEQQSELEQKVEDMKEYQDTMQIIFRNMQDGIIYTDDVNRVRMVNAKAIKLLGKKKTEDYTGKSIFYLIRDERLVNILSAREEISEERIHTEIDERQIMILIIPVVLGESLVGRIIVLRDETEANMLEVERREFTSNVTHELKTPLTSINGYAEMLTNNMVKSEDVPRIGDMILKSGNRMLLLIEKILSLSKIEERQDKEKENFNVKAVIDEVLESVASKAKVKNIAIHSNLSDVNYFGVRDVMEETIYNLVDNGIKYGKENGNIWVDLSEEKKGFKIIVRDDGVGIDELDREKIFQRFYIADKSRNKADASGIGLSIVKHGVEIMGGKVTLESRLGSGSTFEIFVPYNIN